MRPELADGWEGWAAKAVPGFTALDGDAQVRLGELARAIVQEKRWEAAQGLDLAPVHQTIVAVQAALPILELGFDHYRKVKTIIVHRSTVVLQGEQAGPVRGVVTGGPRHLAGQAGHGHGPILLALDTVLRDLKRPLRQQNVVLHEFAHKIDMLDDVADGTPPQGSPAALDRWVAVCTAELDAIRRRDDDEPGPGPATAMEPLLRNYGGTNPAEFFAVATEVFFGRPVEMQERHVDLYDVFRDYYRQDPAARARGGVGADRGGA